jgi:glycosyltransferase involved in cell wall biosynthesis
LFFVGYDHLKQNHSEPLQEMIDNKNDRERIILARKRTDVKKFYLKSKIFAFTSSSEGFPNVTGEALIMGLPDVSYDCDACQCYWDSILRWHQGKTIKEDWMVDLVLKNIDNRE